MLKTKLDVDKHVKDVLSRIRSDEERALRGFQIAKQYFLVKDFETSKRYLAQYLTIRDNNALAHNLMGQLYNSTGHLEKALISYKRCLQLDPKQNDTVLKICDLYCKVPVDPERARYWVDRAEELFPHHEIVFKLRESLLNVDGEPNMVELENLLAAELAARPLDINLRIKLLRLYLHNERNSEAYNHAVEVMKRLPNETNLDWLNCVTDVFEAYQEEQGSDCGQVFYTYLLHNLDRVVYYTLEEAFGLHRESVNPASKHPKSLTDSSCALHSLDQHLYKAFHWPVGHDGVWMEFLRHMQGQLYFHLATIILKRVKDHGSVKEASQMAAALLLSAYSMKPLELNSSWYVQGQPEERKTGELLYDQACFRLCQSGHVIIGLCHEDSTKWLGKVKQQMCTVQYKKKMFERVFQEQSQKPNAATSYFMQDTHLLEFDLQFPDIVSLREYDRVAVQLSPESLHHCVWLAMQSYNLKEKMQPDYGFNFLQGLKFSTTNLLQPSPESLCTLDVDAFLYATVRTTLLCLENKASSLYSSPKVANILPVHACDLLCTIEQLEWWRIAFQLHSNNIKGNIGGARRKLQHGIEVVRAIGNHGMDVRLVIHLAETFSGRAADIKSQSDNDRSRAAEITALEDRAAHYWTVGIEMLHKLEKNQTLCAPKERLFRSFKRDPDSEEVCQLLQDGKFYLAVLDMNNGNLERAFDMFKLLKCPYASYYQATISKKLASKVIGNRARESVTSNMRSRHIILLTKARDCLYETLDRVAGDKKHPLNQILLEEIEDIETKLSRIDPDTVATNEYVGRSNGTISTRDEEDQELDDFTSHLHNQSSPIRHRHGPMLHLTPKSHVEGRVRPSPERLDAQLRVLSNSQELILQRFAQNSEALVEISKAIAASAQQNNVLLQELKLQLVELRQQMPTIFSQRVPQRKRRSAKEKPSVATRSEDDQQSEYDAYDGYYYHEDDYVRLDDGDANDGFGYNMSSAGRGAEQDGRLPQQVATQPNLPYYPSGQLVEGHQLPGHPAVPSTLATPMGPSYYTHPVMPLPTGLNFSEGQKLPQFDFTHSTMGLGMSPATILKTSVFSRLGGEAAPMPKVPDDSSVQATAGSFIDPAASLQFPMGNEQNVNVVTVKHEDSSTIGVPYNAANANILPTLNDMKAGDVLTLSTMPAPHAFQIPLPSQQPHILPDDLGTGHETSVRDNIPCNVFSSIWATSGLYDAKPADGGTWGSKTRQDSYKEESEGDTSCQDFKPLIPLPEVIDASTGEEDETVLFEDRGRLFRFVDKEWKERGIGVIKLLHNEKTDRVRVLMRRDQVLKICANHYICPDMELTPMKNSDRAWLWAARDYADEVVTDEKFCLKLKNPEVAQRFKQVFDKSKAMAAASLGRQGAQPTTTTTQAEPQTGFGQQFLPHPGSWTCDVCCIVNKADCSKCVACEAVGPVKTKPAEVTGFGEQFTPALGSWACSACLVRNNPDVSKCAACETAKPGMPSGVVVTAAPVKFGSAFAKPPGSWTCDSCYIQNEANVFKCAACEANKPGSTEPAAPSKSASVWTATNFTGFGFNANAKSTDSTPFKFGFSSALDTKTTVSTQPDPQLPKVSSGDSPTLPSFVFGRPKSQEESKPSGYVFGQSPVKPPVNDAELVKKDEVASKAPIVFGGFSFKTEPVLQVSDPKTSPTASPESSVEVPKTTTESPFAKFSFGFASKTAVSSVQLSQDIPTLKVAAVTPTVSPGGVNVASPKSEDDFVPNTDFQPVVPLPQLVDVKTGEEDEEQCFAAKARLFRYNAEGKQWKERGVGQLKIMKHKETGRARIIMRRDQVLKVCANHYLTPEMVLKPMSSSNRTWVWLANDFSEGKVNHEMLAAKFEKEDLAEEFKALFEKLRDAVAAKQQQRKDTESTNYDEDQGDDDYEDVDDDEEDDDDEDDDDDDDDSEDEGDEEGAHLEGKRITEAPVSLPSTSIKVSSSPGIVQGPPKLDLSFKPFGNIQFNFQTPTTTSCGMLKSALLKSESEICSPAGNFVPRPNEGNVEFRFGSPQQFNFSFGGISPKSPVKMAKSPGIDGNDDEESNVSAVSADSEVDSVYFQPVIPLPNKIEVKTGEEDEAVLYSQRAKLFRLSGGEWKERGVGDFKILRHKETGRLRMLMRRDHVLKICCNHYLTEDLEFRPKDDKSFMWYAADFSDGVVQQETLAIRFKTVELAQAFKKAVHEARNPSEQKESIEKPSEAKPVSAASSFSFKLDEESPSKGSFSFGDRFGNVTPKGFSDKSFGSPVFGSASDTSDLSKEDFSDVEIIFVKHATPEQQQEAKRLMLPTHFYLYHNAPPCPGCRGCEDESLENANVTVKSCDTVSKDQDESKCESTVEQIEPKDTETNSEPYEEEVSADKATSKLEPLQSNEVSFFTKSPVGNISFASLAQSSATFATKSVDAEKSFKFSGAGATVFGVKNDAEQKDTSNNDDSESHDNSHDPHFEPIIPLPSIVELKTGEEDEEKLYSQRCKLYRFDGHLKQWKERGCGEMKVLKHLESGCCRLLMRREQVFKVVCNHRITKDMKLSPNATCESAWTWTAMDFSGEQGQMETFTLRFKNVELAKGFKQVIEECQQQIKSI